MRKVKNYLCQYCGATDKSDFYPTGGKITCIKCRLNRKSEREKDIRRRAKPKPPSEVASEVVPGSDDLLEKLRLLEKKSDDNDKLIAKLSSDHNALLATLTDCVHKINSQSIIIDKLVAEIESLKTPVVPVKKIPSQTIRPRSTFSASASNTTKPGGAFKLGK